MVLRLGRRSLGERVFDAFNVGILLLMTISFIIPILITYSSSITNEVVLLKEGYQILPRDVSFAAYKFLFRSNNNVMTTIGNSLVITLVGTSFSILVTTMLAYGLSIRDLPFNRALTLFVVFTMYFSGGIIPSYIVYKGYGISNSLIVQFVINMVNPFFMIIMRNYYASLPHDIVESGRIDGANEFRIFSSIILPLCKPMLASLVIFYGVLYWNDWTTFTFYCSSTSVMPMPVLMQRMMRFADEILVATGAGSIPAMGIVPREGIKMSLVVIITLPIIVCYPFLQKYFVKGMTLGAVKG